MAKKNGKLKGLWAEFKEFINRGNAFMLAVGVVIGGAFSAIVNAVVNILLSVATWGVPGGLKGLITVLPAAPGNAAQQGPVGQLFDASELVQKTKDFAASQGVTDLDVTDATFVQWQTALLGKYTLHGTTYAFNGAAVIDWGAFLTAVISFLIIAIVLFIIVKVMNSVARKKEEMEAKAQEEYYKKHPEERPVEEAPAEPAPTELDVLTEIRDQLKALGEKK